VCQEEIQQFYKGITISTKAIEKQTLVDAQTKE
jgi:hypothetical protein